MVEEVRRGRLDLAARAKFAADGEQVIETRVVLEGAATPAPRVSAADRAIRTAAKLQQAAASGHVEAG